MQSNWKNAVEALERIFNRCEEIEVHLPDNEKDGYKMYPDYIIVWEYLQEIIHHDAAPVAESTEE